MKKIPTVFERDWEGDRSRVLDQVHPGCEWVLAGEGIARRKLDGTACLVKDGTLYKRRELKPGQAEPPGLFVGRDEKTGKAILWIEVSQGPEDRWYREAFEFELPNGTYELVGPKVQGNPERYERHTLVRHDAAEVFVVPRSFDGMRDLLAQIDVEGFVFHHPDGRMAKIKSRDFGIVRAAVRA